MKIAVLTSNNYLNVLPGFAYLFNKFYPNQQVEVVRYDVRPPKLPDNFTNFAIGKQSDYTWSGGLKHYLEMIDDEFVLLMLEDYYLDKPVDNEQLKCLEYLMSKNSEIFKIDLTLDRLKVGYKFSEKYHLSDKVGETVLYSETPTIIESDINAPFLASVQSAIWRRDFLIGILNNKDNAWQFEKNKRTKEHLKKQNGVILGCVNPPMSYVNAVGGEGNKPGEYDLKKIPQWMQEELKTNNVWTPK